MDNNDRIDEIRRNGKRAQGRKELLQHLAGGRLTALSALKAQCYECMGYYEGGIQDCECTHCALYPFNPYNPHRRRNTRKPRPGQKPPR